MGTIYSNSVKFFKGKVNEHFGHLSYFYHHLQFRLFITVGLSLVVGVLDGFGLAMFLPLLQVADGHGQVDVESMGNLRFIVEMQSELGIDLNLYSVLLIILLFFILKGVAKFVEAYSLVIVRQYFIKKVRLDNVTKLSNFAYKAFVLADSGRIQNTLSGEVARVAQAYQAYTSAIQAGAMTIVYVVLAFLANAQFAVLVLAGGFVSNLLYKRINRLTKTASRRVTHDGHIYQGLLIQEVGFFKYLKATGVIGKFSAKLIEYITRIEASNRKMGYYGAILQASREPLIILVVVTVILAQVTYFSQGIALILLSLMFFYRSLTFLMVLQNAWNNFLINSGALENMSLFTKELEASQENNGELKIERFRSSIELRDVSFSYGERLVLNNINLTIPRNQAVAIVGESGSGKTTLVNLITGLIPIDHGEMYIDGRLSTKVDISSWQKRIGYITQEPVIFSDTIFNNVSFWADSDPANVERFWWALERAAIGDFVRGLPEKEHTNLGTGGVLLSGGQKQRLTIARELYKDVDVLIMDEATSALDSETEWVIQQNMDLLKGQYTIIIIAHRLATIKSTDCIVLMNQGEIKGQGDFNSLLANASFERMVAFQDL